MLYLAKPWGQSKHKEGAIGVVIILPLGPPPLKLIIKSFKFYF